MRDDVGLRITILKISTGAASTPTGYTYDGNGRLTRVTRPFGLLLDFSYDDKGRPSAATHTRGTTTVGYTASDPS